MMSHSQRLFAWTGSLLVLCAGLLVAAAAIAGRADDAYTDPAKAGPDFAVQGEYTGELVIEGTSMKHGGQVIALGDGKFQVVGYHGGLPGDGWDPSIPPKRYDASAKDGAIEFEFEHGKVKVADGVIEVTCSGGQQIGRLKRVQRKSPTLGAEPPEDAVVLFDGASADEFNGGKLTADKLLNVGVVSKRKFQDFKLHLEFRTPFMPTARGQGRGNSGVYLQNRYEVQVLDSFGLEGKDNECGGIYAAAAPKVNMCFPPLSWQTYDIDFTAARFDDDGKKIKNAVVTVLHNGVPIHEVLELPTFTPGGEGKESPTPGPLQLQDHHNPVHYRNIWIVPKAS